MPITNIYYEDGIFYCVQFGELDEKDAQLWTMMAKRFAKEAAQPIVALIDATRVTYITAAARQILAQASAIHNLHAAAVAVNNFQAKQTARLTAMMAIEKHTEIFDTLYEAERFALNRVALLRGLSRTD